MTVGYQIDIPCDKILSSRDGDAVSFVEGFAYSQVEAQPTVVRNIVMKNGSKSGILQSSIVRLGMQKPTTCLQTEQCMKMTRLLMFMLLGFQKRAMAKSPKQTQLYSVSIF